MTNDEKAKAYDMALEAARKELGCDRKEYKVIEQVLKSIFPELAESEDERIRKAIIHYILYETKGTISEATEHTWVKWLEKQKEQKQTDLPAGFYYIDLEGNKYYSKEFRYGDMKVKVGEPKPVEWKLPDDFEEAVYKVANFISPFNSQEELRKVSHRFAEQLLDIAKKEQKPVELSGELSTNDSSNPSGLVARNLTPEQMREETLKPVEGITQDEMEQAMRTLTDFKVFAAKEAKQYNISHRRDIDWHNFCASLLTYLEVNKPVEWSEEDEKMWIDIKSHMIHGSFIPFDKIEWIENRLKSLRPQWKPTEEQMEALNAMNCCGELSYQGQQQLLIDLYQQLKKLM